jgi:hypothetical protein
MVKSLVLNVSGGKHIFLTTYDVYPSIGASNTGGFYVYSLREPPRWHNNQPVDHTIHDAIHHSMVRVPPCTDKRPSCSVCQKINPPRRFLASKKLRPRVTSKMQ